MADISKRLEKAQKYIEKGKIEQAAEEYRAIVEEEPRNPEHLRTLGDLLTRSDRASEAVHFYGLLFDRYAELNDARKAEALFRKSLKTTPQPPERTAKFGYLMQRLGKPDEALENYQAAADAFLSAGDEEGALGCYEKIATLDPDNVNVQIQVGELATRLRKNDIACKALLRAGQLTVPTHIEKGLELLERAYRLAPTDRTVVLAYAEAEVRKGNNQHAVQLLDALLAENQQDPAFLAVLGDALLHELDLARAESVFEKFYELKPDGYEKLFEVADRYLKAGEGEHALRLVASVKSKLFVAKRQKDFVQSLESLLEANPGALDLAELCARTFNELNQESKYCGALGRLFELYSAAGQYDRAVDTLERLIDVDPYDFNNQNRLDQLRGKIPPERHVAVAARITQSATVTGQAAVFSRGDASAGAQAAPAVSDEVRMRSMLEDMMVQVEIFLQYALRAKALEYLEKINMMFPGEEQKNERLRNLYGTAQFTPKITAGAAAPPPPKAAGAPVEAAEPVGAEPMAGISDLAKISEITHLIYRQSTPKSVLSTAVNELGKYLRASKCLATLGTAGRPPSVAVEFCAPGTPQSSGGIILKLLGLVYPYSFDSSGTVAVEAASTPGLRELGLESVLAIQLVDKDKQADAGLLLVQQADRPRKWRQNEVYLLRAIADQMMIAANHTKMRTLMKTLAVADEKTGVISRGSYLDCLLAEVQRAKTQGTSLSVMLLEIDRGQALMRQVGEALMQNFMQNVGQTLVSNMRQNDIAIKYTAWSLAFVLPDTTAANAAVLAEKMRKTVSAQKPPWDHQPLNLSVGVSEAVIRPDYDVVDAVTDVINRVEFSIEEAHKKGGNATVVK